MRLLIIGDLEGQIGTASKIARDRGAKVTQVENIDSAMESLRNGNGAELILVEVHEDIARLVESLHNERIIVPVVACGVDSDTKAAVLAIKSGAKEYLPLPPDEEMIAAVLESITDESQTIIFASPLLQKVINLAGQVAQSDASILITGESGTGKEIIARYIHKKSKRSGQHLISVNCAAIPENLLESELFGHEKGAFTGAIARRIGKFEEANNGTLLLDEISEMDIRLQAKLLRALQEQEIDRVGGTKPIKVNIRVIATSNRDLKTEAKKGTFREDLYFRLNVINVHIPPLRERPDDILPIAEHFLKKYAKANDLPLRKLSDEATELLLNYEWQGNVRELENVIHRAILVSSGKTIEPEALLLPNQVPTLQVASASAASGALSRAAPSNMVGRTVASIERELILQTLDHCLGNRTHAANILGISIRTLRNKLKIYHQPGDEF